MANADREGSDFDPDPEDATDLDDHSEALDDDVIGPDYPPDEPLGVDDYGTTAAEERIPEPLEERVKREEPDVLDPEPATEEEAEARSRSEEDDFFGDETTRDVATEKEAPQAAEDAAMHETSMEDEEALEEQEREEGP